MEVKNYCHVEDGISAITAGKIKFVPVAANPDITHEVYMNSTLIGRLIIYESKRDSIVHGKFYSCDNTFMFAKYGRTILSVMKRLADGLADY